MASYGQPASDYHQRLKPCSQLRHVKLLFRFSLVYRRYSAAVLLCLCSVAQVSFQYKTISYEYRTVYYFFSLFQVFIICNLFYEINKWKYIFTKKNLQKYEQAGLGRALYRFCQFGIDSAGCWFCNRLLFIKTICQFRRKMLEKNNLMYNILENQISCNNCIII